MYLLGLLIFKDLNILHDKQPYPIISNGKIMNRPRLCTTLFTRLYEHEHPLGEQVRHHAVKITS